MCCARASAQPEVDAGALLKSLNEIAPKIAPFLGSSWRELDAARAGRQARAVRRRAGRAAGHRSRHLSLRHLLQHGGGPGGGGRRRVGPRAIGTVLGIVKSYTTRVGEGPFPTELKDAIGEKLGERGHEFGTVTGRKRRCGWFDAVLVRQTCITGGVDGIALTKLDVLDGFEEIKVCIGYELDGKMLDYLPADANLQARLTPVYETLEGWKETTQARAAGPSFPPTPSNMCAGWKN